jgi:cell division protein FtsB
MMAITLQPTTVKPGEGITVSVYGNESYLLEVSDPNIYFKESLSNRILASPGIYELKVGYETTSGMKSIFVRHENGSYIERRDFLILPLSEADLNSLINSASMTEKELISTMKKVSQLTEEVKLLRSEIEKLKTQPLASDGEELERLRAQINELKLEKLAKENQVSELSQKINELNSTITSLQNQLEELQAERDQLKNQMAKLGSPEFLEATKLGFFFVLAFTAGILISLLRR